MKVTIEISDGELREMVDQQNEGTGCRRGQVGHVTMREAKRALGSKTMRAWLVERALELATDSCADVMAAERRSGGET